MNRNQPTYFAPANHRRTWSLITLRDFTLATTIIGMFVCGGANAYEGGLRDAYVTRVAAVTKHTCPTGIIVVNGARLWVKELAALYTALGGQLPQAGCYWYDRLSGAWGVDGGPTQGQIATNLVIGGPLRADASAGNSGVYVNGRELSTIELARFYQNRIPLEVGRYWMDSIGAVGREGEYASWSLADPETASSQPDEIHSLSGGGSGIIQGDCAIVSGPGYSAMSSGCSD